MTRQKFTAAHASFHNHFNQERHLNRRDIFKRKGDTEQNESQHQSLEHQNRISSVGWF